MEFMLAGLILWSLVHFVPSLGAPLRAQVVSAIGEGGFKGLFSVAMLGSIWLIVHGWGLTSATTLYVLPEMFRPVALALMALAFMLFISARLPTRIKTYLRHPQLVSIVVWSAAHLLVNGDTRSLLLFGGLGLWAILEMFAINHRDGAWVKKPPPGMAQEATVVVVGLVVFAVVMWAHPWLSGVPLI